MYTVLPRAWWTHGGDLAVLDHAGVDAQAMGLCTFCLIFKE